jgi:hypothetical protein
LITYEDCLAFAGLTDEQVGAVARHEHLPRMVALELAGYLSRCADGDRQIAAMIRDDIEVARRRGDPAAAARLRLVLSQFDRTRDEARRAA